MSGYFNKLALSIEAMLGGNAPAVQAGLTDDLSEAEEIRRRAYAATVAAWGSPAKEQATDNAPATRSAGRAAGTGKDSANVSPARRSALSAQAKKAAPTAVKFAATGISSPSAPATPLAGAAAVAGPKDSATITAALRPFAGQNDPIAVFTKVAALAVANDEDERRGRGGGGGRPVPSAVARTARGSSQAQRTAARAAIAAGAQPAVFKVISTAGTKGAAGALLEYLGTRPDEAGKKHDIEVFTSSGLSVETREERRLLLEEWQEDFREPFQNTNFIEVDVELSGDPGRDELHDALNAAFGSKPFIYARAGSTVKVYAYTDMKAAVLAKALQKLDHENGRGRVLQRADDGITVRLKDAGVAGEAEIEAAVSTERGGQYFLQKFIRGNAGVIKSDGEELPAGQRADKAADALYASWKADFKTVEPRNVYHVVFSARAGTDARGLLRAAENLLAEKIPDHKWAIAHHPETGHVHVHAMILARSESGRQLHFSKVDLYDWRAAYAEKAREEGIAMVATSRMDFAASRPFNMRQAGAYERSKRDTRYSVSPTIAERVEAKRQTVFETKTIAACGATIARGWQLTATMTREAMPGSQAEAGAAAFSAAVAELAIAKRSALGSPLASGGEGTPLSPSAEKVDTLIDLTNHIREIVSMELSPLELRRKIADVNKAFDRIDGSLSKKKDKQELAGIREEMNGLLNERLNDVRVQAATGGTAATDTVRDEGRSLREREQQAKTQDRANEQNPRQPDKQAAPGSAAGTKAEQQADRVERQNRDTQRSLDDDRER
ncbi:relaxase/mobilization nuclease domain-containing protein [Mesorhizobium sp. P16.1]|uniref:relaxase/mobilization nuclease domain-containing protein n=1 Tax=unclassified Mesorhizobium TaxID=325217 RepID=UPI0021A45AD8|nr:MULTISPECIES: relaxase/mobilization nuclease domain-containing protein [unclassified Mesorhizobium]MCT2580920.1 relaxase/mobilization nuclease domain-containing protein [Mesorhizobium sp. P13.3]MDF3169941.1 relaxase/mobilization nuclease domain-containing protein [Mesorhizobium sp. P16.1]MDF3181437.1 relaxase/mobilization nuclease domain-containing protein [Mesorhizobium sp. P17.1]MDF3186900.1 relaxase/mobilization nuclease domain-containing protein [Mesorhizobium sp. ICCV3110.1]